VPDDVPDDEDAVFYGVAQDQNTGRWVIVVETPDEKFISETSFETRTGALAAIDQEQAAFVDYMARIGIPIQTQSLPIPPEDQ
jgi:hypothetical protein